MAIARSARTGVAKAMVVAEAMPALPDQTEIPLVKAMAALPMTPDQTEIPLVVAEAMAELRMTLDQEEPRLTARRAARSCASFLWCEVIPAEARSSSASSRRPAPAGGGGPSLALHFCGRDYSLGGPFK
jgi:hypothetical protein